MNLYERISLADELRPQFEKRAKENLKIATGGHNKMTLAHGQKSKPINTDEEVAKIINTISHHSYPISVSLFCEHLNSGVDR